MEADKGTSKESVKDLKKKLKSQKKSAKKEKKKRKIEKKLAKKEVKMRKKGVFLEDIVPEGEKAEGEEEAEVVPEQVVAPQWIKKSAEPIPTIERKIDKIAERTQKPRLHDLFEQKYGETLIVPEIVEEYKLTDDEREHLGAITGENMEAVEVKAEAPVAMAPVIAPAEIKEEELVPVAKAEGVAAAPVEEKLPEVEEKKAVKSFFYPFQLWLYSKFGKDKMIILKIIILLISIVGFFLLLIPRILIYFLILFPIRKIKERKAKAPSGNKKKQKKNAEKPEKAPAES